MLFEARWVEVGLVTAVKNTLCQAKDVLLTVEICMCIGSVVSKKNEKILLFC